MPLRIVLDTSAYSQLRRGHLGVRRRIAACDIAPDRRPQTLGVEEWLALRDALHPLP